MKLITSKQIDIKFIYCASPITVDKTSEWGKDDKNFQSAPKGGWLKINEIKKLIKKPAEHWRDSEETVEEITEEVSHIVQTNEQGIPTGWIRAKSGKSNRFDKQPIWIEDDPAKIFYNPGVFVTGRETVEIQTLDGVMSYKIDDNSVLCANDINGSPNLKDMWINTKEKINKDYNL